MEDRGKNSPDIRSFSTVELLKNYEPLKIELSCNHLFDSFPLTFIGMISLVKQV